MKNAVTIRIRNEILSISHLRAVFSVFSCVRLHAVKIKQAVCNPEDSFVESICDDDEGNFASGVSSYQLVFRT